MTIHQTTFEADKTAIQIVSPENTTPFSAIVGVLRKMVARCGKMFWGYTEARQKADTSSYDGLL